MRHASNEKQETTHDRGNRAIKSRKIRTLGKKGNLQILGNTGSWYHQTSGDERKNKEECLGRTKKLLETRLYSRNLIKEINTWAVPLVGYSEPFLKWAREDLKQMDQRTSKLMTMHKALHPRDDVDGLYVSRKEGGRGLNSIDDSLDASIQRVEDNIEKCRRWLITATRNNTDDTRISRTEITRRQTWEENNSMDVLSDQQTRTWLKKETLREKLSLF